MMATPPDFSVGQVLTAAHKNAVGLWLITPTVTSSGGTAASVSGGAVVLGNGNTSVTITAFSSDFDNYRIVFSSLDSTQTSGSMRMSLNGATGSTYRVLGLYMDVGNTTIFGYAPAAGTSWSDVIPCGDNTSGGVVDLLGPNKAHATLFTAQGVRYGTTTAMYHMTGHETSSAQHVSFTISPAAAGNSFVSGTVRVYGYRN